jgi:hypothetical protein
MGVVISLLDSPSHCGDGLTTESVLDNRKALVESYSGIFIQYPDLSSHGVTSRDTY